MSHVYDNYNTGFIVFLHFRAALGNQSYIMS